MKQKEVFDLFVPTNTYSVERVEPIEDLVNYRDKQGNGLALLHE